MLSFDIPTSLPSQLLTAPPEQVASRGGEVPQLDHAASVQRSLNIRLEGNEQVEALMRGSAALNRCRGASQGNDLFLFEKTQDESCTIWSFGARTRYIARWSDDVSLLISCSASSNINCEIPFPFDGFAPSVSFHLSHLADWRDMSIQPHLSCVPSATDVLGHAMVEPRGSKLMQMLLQ
jgi:hypothetical protein